jgi:rhamnosyltransferase
MEFLYGPEPRSQAAAGPADLTMATTLFSNANSAVRRRFLEEHPFAGDIIMSEDQEWSRRVLLAGERLRYEPRAAVRHSHPYTVREAFSRFFDSGVSSERAYMAGGKPAASVLRRRALDYARGELRWLWGSGNGRWIPYAAVYEGAKFVGLQLGARHQRLPLWLKRRVSALPSYWESI